MKQILSSLKTGETIVYDVPVPQVTKGHVLIKTSISLLSKGTEKMLIDFGKASLFEKARLQPDKLKQVFDKIKTDGLTPTLNAVQTKLDQLLPMGYCNVGMVCDVGADVLQFSVGDRVVSNGYHAEYVSVPKNLCCKVPAFVSDQEAVFTILGAVALQGIRLAKPTAGECFVVIGLGLIGLLTLQLLIAQGIKVLAVDLDENKLELANSFGAEVFSLKEVTNFLSAANTFSRNRGVDAVLITANTKSNDPIKLAAKISRKKGRIVLIGVTGLNLSRADFYEKELSFQVSCAYGPGRYDPFYEEEGHDYPFGYVRWTAQRNFEAVLDFILAKKISLASLISYQFEINQAHDAYAKLSTDSDVIGILLTYHRNEIDANQKLISIPQSLKQKKLQLIKPKRKNHKPVTIGLIGAGQYAARTLLPALLKTNIEPKIIACRQGVSGAVLGKKFGFKQVTTEADYILQDETISAVIIASRHDSHAHYACEAIKAGKHVFVEKPLCLNFMELNAIHQAVEHSHQLLMIGFNRRFASQVQKIKSLLTHNCDPKIFILTINAGELDEKHWAQDKNIGGGRLIGEVCHFIDLLRYLAGSSIKNFHKSSIGPPDSQDKLTITLHFTDGSMGTIHYFSNGHRAYQKERLEIFVGGKILQLNNFIRLKAYGFAKFKRMNLWRQDKGQEQCIDEFITAIQNDLSSPIAFDEIYEVSKKTLEIAECLP